MATFFKPLKQVLQAQATLSGVGPVTSTVYTAPADRFAMVYFTNATDNGYYATVTMKNPNEASAVVSSVAPFSYMLQVALLLSPGQSATVTHSASNGASVTTSTFKILEFNAKNS